MSRAEIELFDVVRIVESPQSLELELAGAEGIVLGISRDDAEDECWYAVQVGNMPVVMLPDGDLRRTGRSVRRDQVYPGERVRVSRAGRPVEAEREADDGESVG